MKHEDLKRKNNNIIEKKLRKKRIKYNRKKVSNFNDDLFNLILIVDHITFIN